jgi:GWxTD domain-containing protein
MPRGRSAVPFLFALLLASGASGQAADPEDWSTSPEAYFLTSEERTEWKTLDSGLERDRFKERYWLKRDPTPGTEKNEFRDVILGRIKNADARFPIGKVPGSRTKRGMVFVVFGTPARVNDTKAAPLEAPRPPSPGNPAPIAGVVEGNETTSVWVYDRERTPRLLEMLGDRPSLELTFVVEPTRRRDLLQNPGLFDEYRETLARRSIVNPDVVPAAPAPAAPAPAPPAVPRAALSAPIRAALDAARATPRGEDGSVFGSATLWSAGEPETLVWFFLPEPDEDLMLFGRVRTESGEEVATVSERATPVPFFSTSSPKGEVVMKRLQLPPGRYSAAFAIQGKRVQGAASAPIQVPRPQGEFAVSSLILSAGAGKADSGSSGPFVLGASAVPPRADAEFLRSESLWYFLEISGPADPSAVTLETRLRRGAEQVGASGPTPAGLVEAGPGRYVSGFEMPLATLPAGDYVLYVTVRDGSGAGATTQLRRADFRIRDSNPSR